jgi:hypothetical protein
MPTAVDRRQFLQAASASALAALIPTSGAAITGPGAADGRVRVAILNEPFFPAVDTPRPDLALLGAALDGFEVEHLRVSEVNDRLSPERHDVFVTPYGSAVPKDVWPALLRYLDGAGNWVNLGGVPCAVPVERVLEGGGDDWRALPREVTYHKQLGITFACDVRTAAVGTWRANAMLPWASALAEGVAADTVWEAYWRLSGVADTPEESGSPGPSEAVVVPLVTGLDGAGRAVAAPFVMVDRLEREFAGGRWIFATGDGAVAPATIRTLVEAASLGARQLIVQPSFACYRDGDRPSVSVAFRSFPRAGAAPFAATCRVEVTGPHGNALAPVAVAVEGTQAQAFGLADLDLAEPRAPGLYRLDAVLTVPGPRPLELRHTTGFWVWDEKLLAAGAPLGAGPHALTRGGEPFPVTGTTYMASDVHRKYLLQPNPWQWDRDFAAMKRAGVNLVRTGLWSGWKAFMPKVGELDGAACRALDAWLLTARRHDVPVIFTLFAFLPESWAGENPYLDPAAVAAQRAFVSLIARRYARMHDLAWDLINEPSFCNKDHLWSCRPNYDRFETAAWADWLAKRHPDRPPAALPPLEDFGEGDHAVVRPTQVLEYRLFAQEMFRRWVREMRTALRAPANPRQLVTVGQDEAGTRDSPNNLFLAPDLDFTCVHTWWLNDALVWDEVVTKAPGKTNLVEETGVMFAAHPPGAEARWEEYARNLLERKMAIALGPGGAGFVEWVWNSNCYMPSDNEAAIGLLRADGTAKPELAAFEGMAAFAAQARRHLVGREEERVLLVVPHANMFSTGNTATDATKRAVRGMQYGCRMGLSAVSEFAVTPEMRVPRLALVPSPGTLSEKAWDAVEAWARRGSVVLVTGPLERLGRLGSRKAVGPSGAVRIPLGRGALLWSARSVELDKDDTATVELYRWALGRARLAPAFTVAGADASVLVHAAEYHHAVLFTLVSESPRSSVVRLRRRGARRDLEVTLPGERAALLLVNRLDGRVIARYQPG